MSINENTTLICFSHLRWNFVYQRPQHLMSRFAKTMRVIFIEEPYFGDSISFEVTNPSENLWIAVPHLKREMNEAEVHQYQKDFISRLLIKMKVSQYVAWYYTPMALRFTDHLNPAVIVYDCMDELTGFKFAPQELKDLEKELLSKANVVFTGGYSLYEAKKHQHHSIFPFPSSIEYTHFAKARSINEDPPDQADVAHPRFGFYGVIDERMDIELIRQIAEQKKDWNIILIGPVVKIDEHDLPRLPNIHYLGMKKYEELPQYLAGWDVAIMPFAINDATRFISPTKTPEFLAAGKPVISTPINDVIKQYSSVVHFATTAEDFIRIADSDMSEDSRWLNKVDEILKENSWDKTWQRMNEKILNALYKARNRDTYTEKKQEYV
jgi:glycosyltransferase involved in cell wall biosynthesis